MAAFLAVQFFRRSFRAVADAPGMLENFYFRLCAQLLVQIRAQLLVLALLQIGTELRLHFFVAQLARGRVRIQADDGERLVNLNQVTHLARLHYHQHRNHLRWQFVALHDLVISHVYAVVVFGELLCQKPETPGNSW